MGIHDLLSKTSRSVSERASSVQLRVSDSSEKGVLVFYSGDHVIRISDLEGLKISCSCPFWRFQGPEYWAKEKDYLLGDPVGQATKPKTRDSDNNHYLCKHSYAALKTLLSERRDLSLKNALIRLAYSQPRFRSALVPILKEASQKKGFYIFPSPGYYYVGPGWVISRDRSGKHLSLVKVSKDAETLATTVYLGSYPEDSLISIFQPLLERTSGMSYELASDYLYDHSRDQGFISNLNTTVANFTSKKL